MNNASDDSNVREILEKGKDILIRDQLLQICTNQLPAYLEKNLAPALKRLLSPEDIAQETYLKAAQSLKEFAYQGEGKLFGWLVSIANNHAITALRKSRSRQVFSVEDGFIDGLFESGMLSPSKHFSLKENREMLAKSLESLSEVHRAVVYRRYYENKKFVEIAAELGKTPEQVRGLHRNALKQLFESFQLIEKFKSSTCQRRI